MSSGDFGDSIPPEYTQDYDAAVRAEQEELQAAPPVYGDDGQPIECRMGLVASPDDFDGLPKFSGTVPLIDKSQWQDISFADYDVPITYQRQNGCVGHGATSAFQKAWLMSGGTPHDFSPTYTYAMINGGRDQGAQITSALRSLQNGVCLFEQCGEETYFKSKIKPEAFETAKRFRLADAYVADSPEAAGSGLQLGYILVLGVTVNAAFQAFRGTGVCPSGMGPANHCIYADGMRLVNGVWLLDVINSWSTAWGNKGRALFPLNKIAREMFLVRSVILDPQETLFPPAAG